MGFWDEAVQEALLKVTIAIAGNGGTGNLLGLELARIGVQRFRVADPETFDEVNANRVMGARVDTIGMNKAHVLKDDILLINPAASVITYESGISPGNVGEFLSGVDIVLNGLELTKPELAVMLARAARNNTHQGKPKPLPIVDVEYIGHAGQGVVFDPLSSMTFERFMGIRGNVGATLETVAKHTISVSRFLAYLPPYGDLATLRAMQRGAPLPSNMIGAGVAAQIGLAEVLKLIRKSVGQPGVSPTYAPAVRWYDAYTNRSGLTRRPRLSHYRHLAIVLARNILRRQEAASYRLDERAARGDRISTGSSAD